MTRARRRVLSRTSPALSCRSAVLAAVVAGLVLAAPAAPAAAAPTMATSGVMLTASPIFGADEVLSDGGWMEVVVHVRDAGPTAVKGTIEITADASYSGSDTHLAVRAPFHVQARSEATVLLPLRRGSYVPSLGVVARSEGGAPLATTGLTISGASTPMLVELSEPSRLSPLLRGRTLPSVAPPASTPSYGSTPTVTLAVAAPSSDPVTGDLIVPDRVAAYSGVTVVVVASNRLARLQAAEVDALTGWVAAGGTLAVYPTRPEDLRTGVLPTLVGGALSTTAPPAALLSRAWAPSGAGAPPISPDAAPSFAPEVDPSGAKPIAFVPQPSPRALSPVRTAPVPAPSAYGPAPSLRATLVGYTGGAVKPSAFGATASYGLGRVHVLGFDPASPTAIEDRWAQARVLEMVADAVDYEARLVFPQGAGDRRGVSTLAVHRLLDPNESFRPTLGVAAVLLVLYSILAGPLTFLRARKRNLPLRPLLWVPVASAGCFATIVVVGLAGKGWVGRARRLSMVEAPAGASHGVAHRFRGFFSSRARSLQVPASGPRDVLDVMSSSDDDPSGGVLAIDKDATSLEGVSSLPWQTLVVAEDGTADLGGAIVIHEQNDGTVTVTNATVHKLKDVVVWAPATQAAFFASIEAGSSVSSSSGTSVFTPTTRSVRSNGARVVHDLGANEISSALGTRAEEMTTAWSALANASGMFVDWWPDGVPVVIAEVVGGEGTKSDSGLRVDRDRLLVRVVGQGGAP